MCISIVVMSLFILKYDIVLMNILQTIKSMILEYISKEIHLNEKNNLFYFVILADFKINFKVIYVKSPYQFNINKLDLNIFWFNSILVLITFISI